MDRPATRRAFIDVKRVCQEVSILDLAGGADRFRKAGDHWLGHAPNRTDSNPSLHVWEPGTGRNPEKGWNFFDFGANAGGGPVEFIMLYEGMTWREALEKCGTYLGSQAAPVPRHVTPPAHKPAQLLSIDDQRRACALIGDHLERTRPMADRWLREQRGLDPAHAHALGDCFFVMNQQHCWQIGDHLRAHHRDLAVAGGLLRKPADNDPQQRERFFLWDQSVILGSRDADGRLVSLRARRTAWHPNDLYGKYVAQNFGAGTTAFPFGLAAAREAKEEKKPLIILEGGFDAIGARQLGLKAIGLGVRPGFIDHQEAFDTVQGRWFREHRELFTGIPEILILPDHELAVQDPVGHTARVKEEVKGRHHAEELARFLHLLDLPARSTSMAELGHGGFKDMAQAADPKHR
jgi:hypothetical protein